MDPRIRDFKDVNDAASQRREAEYVPIGRAALRHLMQHCPMFFRRNGAPVELVNLYQGQSVFLICNGPSFGALDQSQLKRPGILTFGMNNGAHLFRPNFWVCVDEPIRFMSSIWSDGAILKFIPVAHFEKPTWDNAKNQRSNLVAGDYPNVIGFRRNERFVAERWIEEDTINWGNHASVGGGRSVMLVALRICHLLGFAKVYLVGCDFQMDQNHKYWFDEDRHEQAIRNNTHSYQRLTEYFTALKPRLEESGFEIYNLNPESRLRVFPFRDFDAAIEENLIDQSASTRGMYVGRSEAKPERRRDPMRPPIPARCDREQERPKIDRRDANSHS